MTTFAPDVDLDSDVDPLDPTAAPVDHGLPEQAGGVTATVRRHSYPLEVVGAEAARPPIRAWFDDSGRLARFTITNRWRERLLGRDLGEEITAVLRQPRSTAAAVTAPEPTLSALPTQLSREWLDQLYEESTRDQERAADPVEEQSVTGRSRSQLVRVELDLDGRARSVSIDSTWLSRCRVGDLCEAVIEAHQSASDALAALPRPMADPADSMSARADALFAVLTGRTAA
ncbi:hypothetical protein ACQBAR_06670 [Propionibacteriaceae bacterium Y1685]